MSSVFKNPGTAFVSECALRAAQLEKCLEKFPFDYSVAAELLSYYVEFNDNDGIQSTRDHIARYCLPTDEFWLDWISDVQKLGATDDAFLLFEKGLSSSPSVTLWLRKIQFCMDNKYTIADSTMETSTAIKETMESYIDLKQIFEDALSFFGNHPSEAGELWSAARDLEDRYLIAFYNADDLPNAVKHAKNVRALFGRQLSSPISGLGEVRAEMLLWEANLPDECLQDTALVTMLEKDLSGELGWAQRKPFERKVEALAVGLSAAVNDAAHHHSGISSTSSVSASANSNIVGKHSNLNNVDNHHYHLHQSISPIIMADVAIAASTQNNTNNNNNNNMVNNSLTLNSTINHFTSSGSVHQGASLLDALQSNGGLDVSSRLQFAWGEYIESESRCGPTFLRLAMLRALSDLPDVPAWWERLAIQLTKQVYPVPGNTSIFDVKACNELVQVLRRAILACPFELGLWERLLKFEALSTLPSLQPSSSTIFSFAKALVQSLPATGLGDSISSKQFSAYVLHQIKNSTPNNSINNFALATAAAGILSCQSASSCPSGVLASLPRPPPITRTSSAALSVASLDLNSSTSPLASVSGAYSATDLLSAPIMRSSATCPSSPLPPSTPLRQPSSHQLLLSHARRKRLEASTAGYIHPPPPAGIALHDCPPSVLAKRRRVLEGTPLASLSDSDRAALIEESVRESWDGSECAEPATAPPLSAISANVRTSGDWVLRSPHFGASPSHRPVSHLPNSHIPQLRSQVSAVSSCAANDVPSGRLVWNRPSDAAPPPSGVATPLVNAAPPPSTAIEAANSLARPHEQAHKGNHHLQLLEDHDREQLESRQLWISNLASVVTHNDLQNFLRSAETHFAEETDPNNFPAPLVKLKSCRIAMNHDGTSKGFAYADFSCPEGACKAQQYLSENREDNKLFGLKPKVLLSKPTKAVYEPDVIFLANLPWPTEEEGKDHSLDVAHAQVRKELFDLCVRTFESACLLTSEGSDGTEVSVTDLRLTQPTSWKERPHAFVQLSERLSENVLTQAVYILDGKPLSVKLNWGDTDSTAHDFPSNDGEDEKHTIIEVSSCIVASKSIPKKTGHHQAPESKLILHNIRNKEKEVVNLDAIKRTLLVKNLSFKVSEGGVEHLFERIGPVARCVLVRDAETKKSRGYAFVEMKDSNDAVIAVTSLNGRDVSGRNISVEHSTRVITEHTSLSTSIKKDRVENKDNVNKFANYNKNQTFSNSSSNNFSFGTRKKTLQLNNDGLTSSITSSSSQTATTAAVSSGSSFVSSLAPQRWIINRTTVEQEKKESNQDLDLNSEKIEGKTNLYLRDGVIKRTSLKRVNSDNILNGYSSSSDNEIKDDNTK